MIRRAIAAVTGGAIAAAVIASFACSDDARSHVFSGRQYDPTRHCLENLQSIDVVAGPEPVTSCAPACIVSEATDGSDPSILYVSTMCPPYPLFPYERDGGGDPRCAAALVAFHFDTSCEADGAIVNLPPDASDADGGDADATDANAPDAIDASRPDASDANPD